MEKVEAESKLLKASWNLLNVSEAYQKTHKDR